MCLRVLVMEALTNAGGNLATHCFTGEKLLKLFIALSLPVGLLVVIGEG